MLPQQVKHVAIGDLLPSTDWSAVLTKLDIIIHTPLRHEFMSCMTTPRSFNRISKNKYSQHLKFSKQAATAGVSRFIFISSIKVNGETTSHNQKFSANDTFIPSDPYALSKYDAEIGLLNLAKKTNMEVVIIRPPLVYGPLVKGNFSSLIKWIKKNIPLPFGTVHNQRSLVALDNLVDFIILCTTHPNAANEIFLISDDSDISTTELLKKIAQAFNKKGYLLPIPVSFLTLLAKLTGNKKIADRIVGSLQIDISKAKHLLHWKPVTTIDKQLKKITETYK